MAYVELLISAIKLKKKQITHVMAEKILHRGPDDSGVFGDENISLGFKRLSILDIKNGNQPIFNKNKSIVSIFNGEIYNFKEIKKELIEKGYNFLTEAKLRNYTFCL